MQGVHYFYSKTNTLEVMFCFCHRAALSHPSFCWSFLPKSNEPRTFWWLRRAFIFQKNICPSSDIKHHFRMKQWYERCNRSKKGRGEKINSSAVPVSLGSKLFTSISWQSRRLCAGRQQSVERKQVQLAEKGPEAGWQCQCRLKISFKLEEIK